VFLDEIGEINQATQIKLLGVLENKQFRRLGGTVNIPVDIRIIAATNKDLKKAVDEKVFREDLYYRLKVFQISIPALREHKEDVALLSDYFIKYYNIQFQKNISNIQPEVNELLTQYNWPGNIRELRNVIERAVILENTNILQVESLPGEIISLNKPGDNGAHDKPAQDAVISESRLSIGAFELPDEGISLFDIEKQIIKKALENSDYNQTKASKLLRISRDTLRYKLKKYNL
jgi:transcriptional regulator with PAS, ATPase and Fis domain